jgi:hypothetical protein
MKEMKEIKNFKDKFKELVGIYFAIINRCVINPFLSGSTPS